MHRYFGSNAVLVTAEHPMPMGMIQAHAYTLLHHPTPLASPELLPPVKTLSNHDLQAPAFAS